MLPRRLRLTRASFPDTRTSKRVIGDHLSISYGAATPAKAGVSVVISKKVAKTAVARHLFKRRIMEIVRSELSNQQYLIIYARTGAAELSFSKLSMELYTLLKGVSDRKH